MPTYRDFADNCGKVMRNDTAVYQVIYRYYYIICITKCWILEEKISAIKS